MSLTCEDYKHPALLGLYFHPSGDGPIPRLSLKQEYVHSDWWITFLAKFSLNFGTAAGRITRFNSRKAIINKEKESGKRVSSIYNITQNLKVWHSSKFVKRPVWSKFLRHLNHMHPESRLLISA